LKYDTIVSVYLFKFHASVLHYITQTADKASLNEHRRNVRVLHFVDVRVRECYVILLQDVLDEINGKEIESFVS